MSLHTLPPAVVHYPDDDGLPMSDNSWQFNWISLLKWGIEIDYLNTPDVFVAGNHLIYPVEGDADTRTAPDVYVAFGRPKHDRGSYKVWEEGGVFPQVVFEVWSPSNTTERMEEKLTFYEKYGAEEYYIVYPEFPMHADGWRRDGGKLARIPEMNGHVSPRLGIRFVLNRGELAVFGRDGRQLRTPAEVAAERDAAVRRAEQEAVRAAEERRRAEQEAKRANQSAAERDAERQRAEQETARVEEQHRRAEQEAKRAESAEQHAERERQRAERLAAKLRELGLDPDAS
jgi:Uma2 family endonuclease